MSDQHDLWLELNRLCVELNHVKSQLADLQKRHGDGASKIHHSVDLTDRPLSITVRFGRD